MTPDPACEGLDPAVDHGPSPRDRLPRRGELLALALSAIAFSLVLHWPVLLGRIPFPADAVLSFPPWESIRVPEDLATKHGEMSDVAFQVWPFRVLLVRAIREGSLPAWNPSFLMGAPLAANAQTAAFYPATLAYLLLPMPVAWAVVALFRTAAAWWLTAVLARALGSSRAGAAVAASAYATCGFLTAWEGWTNSDAAVWLPAVLLGSEMIARGGGRRWLAATTLAYALSVLAGHPEVAFYVAGAGAAFFARRVAGRRDRPAAGPVLVFLAACVLAIGLASVQIAPTLEWLSLTAREPNAGRYFPPAPLSAAVSFFSRDLSGNPTAAGSWVPEGAAYAGLATLFLCPFAFVGTRRNLALHFVLVLAASIAAIFGVPPVRQLLERLPVVGHFPNNRLILLADFSLAMLAGLGLTTLADPPVQEEVPRRRRALFVAALLVPTAGVAWSVVRTLSNRENGSREGDGALIEAFVILAALWAIAVFRGVRRLPPRFVAAALAVLSVVDGMTFASRHVPYVKPSRVWPEPSFVRFLRTGGPEPYRVVSVDGSVPINAEAVFGLESPAGYDFVLARVREFLLPLTRSVDPSLLAAFDAEAVVSLEDRRFDMANVRYVVATTWNRSAEILSARGDRFREVHRDGRLVVFENLRCLPRAMLIPAGNVRAVGGRAEALAAVSSIDFDPKSEAVVEGEVPSAMPRGAATSSSGSVRFLAKESDEALLEVDAPAPSLLVVAETVYPGWKATVDGVETPVITANHVFRGVWVEAGRHRVHLRFRPTSVAAGGAVSVVCLAVALALLLVPRRV